MPSTSDRPSVLALFVLVAGCVSFSAEAQGTGIVIAPPASVSVAQGNTVVFVCVAYSRDLPTPATPRIDWRQGEEVLNSAVHPRLNITETLVNKSGTVFVKSVLQLCGVKEVDAANYSCSAAGSNDSVSFELVVTHRPVPAQIVIKPADKRLYQNSTVLLTCVAYGVPLPTLTWSKAGNSVTNGTVRNDMVVKGGVTFVRSVLQLCETTVADSGQYTCTADNEITIANAHFRLTVEVPLPAEVVLLSEDTLVSARNTILLTCVGLGNPPPSLSWEKEGLTTLQNNSRTTIFERVIVKNGFMFTRSVLQICRVTAEGDTGSYNCTATNIFGNDSTRVELTVHIPVQVVLSPSDVRVHGGSTLLLTAIGYGTPLPTVSWMHLGENLTNTSQIKIYESVVTKNGSSFAKSVLEICGVEYSTISEYTVSMSNRITAAFASFNIFVRDPVQIVLSPEDLMVAAGNLLGVACVAFGDPLPSIYWSKDGAALENDIQITILENLVAATDPDIAIYEHRVNKSGVMFVRSVMRIRHMRLIDRGQYSCSAHNGFTNASSSSFLVTVTAPPEILVSPPNATAFHGTTILFSCIAYGVPLPTFLWTRNRHSLFNDSSTVIYKNKTTKEGIVFVKSVLEICNLRVVEDSGVYSCIAESVNSSASANFELAVQVPVSIVVSSGNIGIDPGQSVLLTCISRGLPVPSIMWTDPSGSVITRYTNPRIKVFESTETRQGVTFVRSILQLCDINRMDSGEYTCIADNTFSNDTATISVCALEPSGLVVHPEDTVVIAGSTVMLTCVAFGEPLPSITWSLDGANVTNDTRTEIIEMRTTRNGRPFIKSVLQICGVGESDAGRYNCTAVNVVNTDSADFSLTVISEPATLVMVPEDIVTLAGVSVTLTCVAFGYPIPTIRWEKSDHITRATVRHTNTTQIINRVISRNTTQFHHSTLFLCSSEVISTATYSCIANNGLDGGETTRVDITVDVRVLPTIMESRGVNSSLQVGQSVIFVCTADGAPIPSITWFKDGCRVQTTLNRRFDISENLVSGFQPHLPQARRSVLTLSELREEDAGNYFCGVSNEVDTAILAEPYTLIVSRDPPNYCLGLPCRNGGTCSNHQYSYSCSCPFGVNGVNCENRNPVFSEPSMMEAPQTTFVGLYQSASFTCTVSGNPQPNITWYKDGREILGQRLPRLRIAEVDLADRGAYHCTASAREGSVTSDPAFLNIMGITQYTATIQPALPTGQAELNASLPKLKFRAAGQQLSVMGDNTATIHCIEHHNSLSGVQLIVTVLSEASLDSARVETALTSTVIQVGRELGLNVLLSNVLRFDGCREETTIVPSSSIIMNDLDTSLTWSEVPIGTVAEVQCVCGIPLPRTATRLCAGNFVSGGQWNQPLDMKCNFTNVVRELCLMPESNEVVDLTANTDQLGSLGIHLATEIMWQRLQNVTGHPTESGHFFTIIDNILSAPLEQLQASHEEFNTSGRLLVAIDELADSYPVTNETFVITKNNFAMAIYPEVNTFGFPGEGFSADLGKMFTFNGTKVLLVASDNATASISLPATLLDSLNTRLTPRLVFSFFLNEGLFVRRREYLQNNNVSAIRLGSIVIASHITGGVRVSNLQDPVRTTFITNPELLPAAHVECSYWDLSLDEGFGAWSTEGCSHVVRVEDDAGKVVCDCDHLTNFAVLLDVTPTGIGELSYIGGVICIVFLIPTIIFLAVRSLRPKVQQQGTGSSTTPSSIGVLMINFCVALTALYTSFIIPNYITRSSSTDVACAALSAMFHYFFLVSALAFTLMVFVRFRKFEKRKNVVVLVTAVVITWVVPLFVVMVSILPDYTNYITDEFCRPVKWPYWISLLGISGVLHLQTWIGLVVAPCFKPPMSRRSEIDSRLWLRETAGLITSLLLYDIAWGFGLPATHTIGRPYILRSFFQGIFITASALLGCTIFVFFLLAQALGEKCGRGDKPSTKQAEEHIYDEPGPTPAKIDLPPLKLEEVELEPNSGYPNPNNKSPTSITMEAASKEAPPENAPEKPSEEATEEATEF